MKIAVYGGSFDPFHIGHGIVAQYVAQWGGVDEVWVMPSARNPLKVADSYMATDEQRLDMARCGTTGCVGVNVSDFEYSMPSPSYSYDTLCALRHKYPEHDFTLLVGGDNWECFDKWRNSDKIIREFGVIVYPRPGTKVEIEPGSEDRVSVLEDAPQVMMSSTFLRRVISEGFSVVNFVSPEVAEYIKQNKIYNTK